MAVCAKDPSAVLSWFSGVLEYPLSFFVNHFILSTKVKYCVPKIRINVIRLSILGISSNLMLVDF